MITTTDGMVKIRWVGDSQFDAPHRSQAWGRRKWLVVGLPAGGMVGGTNVVEGHAKLRVWACFLINPHRTYYPKIKINTILGLVFR